MFTKDVDIKNKKAGFEYELLEKFDAGIMLRGTEIKSIREGKVSMNDAWCYFSKDELYLKNLNISEYDHGTFNNHDPMRIRKLLLQKRELKKLLSKTKERGFTIVPLRIYTNERGFAKIEIALARGKKLYNKRNNLKEREAKREVNRVNKHRY